MEKKYTNFYQRIRINNIQEVITIMTVIMSIIIFFVLYALKMLDYWFCLLETLIFVLIVFCFTYLLTITSMYISVNKNMIAVKGYNYMKLLEESDVVGVDLCDIVNLDFEIVKRKYNAREFAICNHRKMNKEKKEIMWNEIGKIFMIITDKDENKFKVLINDFSFDTFRKLLITLKNNMEISKNPYSKEINPDLIIDELSNNKDNPMESTYTVL